MLDRVICGMNDELPLILGFGTIQIIGIFLHKGCSNTSYMVDNQH